MVLPVLFGGLALGALTTWGQISEPLAYAACIVSIVVIGNWIFRRIYRHDRDDLARLEASDRESVLARTHAPIEPVASQNVETGIR